MEAPIFKTTDEVEKICKIVESNIEQFLEVKKDIAVGTYEYEVTALTNIFHSIRILESIVELARKDLVFVQPALVLARSVFEGMIKTSWILLPNDNFIKETRYVAYLETECEYLERVSKNLGGTEERINNILNTKQKVNEFKTDLSKLLNDKGYSIPKFPNVKEILKELNAEQKYLFYVMLSQYTHFSHHSSTIYQKNLGTEKIFTETENIDLWKLAFSTSLPIFKLAIELFLRSLGYKQQLFTDIQAKEFEKIIFGT